MRWHRLAVLVGCLVGLATTPASGVWGDTSQVDGSSLQLLTLAAPTLSCAESTGPLLSNAATISWTPSATPTTLSYTARVVNNGDLLTVVSNTSTQLYPSLLSTLFGSTVTVRVTGTLPGTSWTVSSDRTVVVGPLGTFVNCS